MSHHDRVNVFDSTSHLKFLLQPPSFLHKIGHTCPNAVAIEFLTRCGHFDGTDGNSCVADSYPAMAVPAQRTHVVAVCQVSCTTDDPHVKIDGGPDPVSRTHGGLEV